MTNDNSHYIRYGIPADQHFLLDEFLDSYDCIIVNASMQAHATSALSKFLAEKVPWKQFAIDPQTHAFQASPEMLQSKASAEKQMVKRSVLKIAEQYGTPIIDVVHAKKKLEAVELLNCAELDAFVKRVLEFQSNAVEQEVQAGAAQDYYEFLRSEKGEEDPPQTKPEFLFSPYFFIGSSDTENWIRANCIIASISVELAQQMDAKLAVQVLAHSRILHDKEGYRKAVVNGYTQSLKQKPPNCIFLWVDDFDEHEASSEELVEYGNIIRELGQLAPVVLPYGSYWSIACMKAGILPEIHGVGHSLGYGEHRQVFPVGGGLPIPRFYLKSLHKRMKFGSALAAAEEIGGMESRDAFLERVCSCRQCEQLIVNPAQDFIAQYGEVRATSFQRKGRTVNVEYPTPETQRNCVAHYMWCKMAEYQSSTPATRGELVDALRNTRNDLLPVLGYDEVGHLERWISALEH